MNNRDLEKLHDKIELLIKNTIDTNDAIILQNQGINKMNELIIELIGYLKIQNNSK